MSSLSTSDRRMSAYARLGVSPLDVAKQPSITPQLRKALRQCGEIRDAGDAVDTEGRAMLVGDPIYYLRASDSPDARKVLDAYYSIGATFRALLPLEAFCVAAAIPTPRVFEIIVGTAVRLGAQASTLIAAVSHPAVVRKTVEMALTDEGHEDRAILHRAVGFTPLPKGSVTTVNVSAAAQANAASVASLPALAPPPEQTVRRLAERMDQQRGLLAPSAATPALSPASDELAPQSLVVAAEYEEVGAADEDDG